MITMSDGDTTDGIQIDMIGETRMKELGTAEKIDMILRGVREGKIVILESGLRPDEESRLIERTMGSIEPEGFTGIEIESYPSEENTDSGLVNRLLSRDGDSSADKLTVIGPADRMETLEKNESLISTMITKH